MSIDPLTDWKPYFRALGQQGLRGFFAFFLASFALLVGLGTWQLQRLEWKTTLIETLQKNLNAPPVPLAEALVDILTHTQNPDYKKVTLTGTLDLSNPFKLLMQTHDVKGQSTLGYHLIYPCDLETGGRILVDIGWVPQDITPETFAQKLPPGPLSLVGVLKSMSGKTAHTPENLYEKDELFFVDPAEIAKTKGWSTLLPFYIIRTSEMPELDAYPLLSPPQLSIRNTHLEYAIIWYVLALFWGVIFVLYLRRFVKKTL